MLEEFISSTSGKLILQIGFPAFMSLLLLGFIYQLMRWHRDDRTAWEKEQKALHESTLEVIQNSTEVLTKLNVTLETALRSQSETHKYILDELRQRR